MGSFNINKLIDSVSKSDVLKTVAPSAAAGLKAAAKPTKKKRVVKKITARDVVKTLAGDTSSGNKVKKTISEKLGKLDAETLGRKLSKVNSVGKSIEQAGYGRALTQKERGNIDRNNSITKLLKGRYVYQPESGGYVPSWSVNSGYPHLRKRAALSEKSALEQLGYKLVDGEYVKKESLGQKLLGGVSKVLDDTEVFGGQGHIPGVDSKLMKGSIPVVTASEALDIAGRPGRAVVGTAGAIAKGENVLDAIGGNLSGKRKDSVGKLLAEAGAPKGVASTLGFIGDVALDPTTYVGIGPVVKARRLAKVGSSQKAKVRSLPKTEKLVSKLVENKRRAATLDAAKKKSKTVNNQEAENLLKLIKRPTDNAADKFYVRGFKNKGKPVRSRKKITDPNSRDLAKDAGNSVLGQAARTFSPRIAPKGVTKDDYEIARQIDREFRAGEQNAVREPFQRLSLLNLGFKDAPDVARKKFDMFERGNYKELKKAGLFDEFVTYQKEMKNLLNKEREAGFRVPKLPNYVPHESKGLAEQLGLSEGKRKRSGRLAAANKRVFPTLKDRDKTYQHVVDKQVTKEWAGGMADPNSNFDDILKMAEIKAKGEIPEMVENPNVAAALRMVKSGIATNRNNYVNNLFKDIGISGKRADIEKAISPNTITDLLEGKTDYGLYRLVSDGTGKKAIRQVEDAPGEKVFEGLANKEFKLLPKKIVEDPERAVVTSGKDRLEALAVSMGGKGAKDVPSRLARGMDKTTAGLKTLQTATPGYHVTNIMGDTSNAIQAATGLGRGGAAAKHVKNLIKATGAVTKNPEKWVDQFGGDLKAAVDFIIDKKNTRKYFVDGEEKKISELYREAEKFGAVNIGKFGGDINDTRGIGQIMRQEAKALKGKKRSKAMKTVERVNLYRENLPRFATYLEGRTKLGMSPRAAAAHSAKYHIDYAELTKSERILRIFFPFYTFTARSLPLQAELLVKNPRVPLSVDKAANEVALATGADYEGLPDNRKQQGLFPVGKDTYFASKLPFNDLLALKNMQDVGSKPISMLNPLIKVPGIELPLNYNSFFRQPIKDSQRGTDYKYAPELARPLLKVPGFKDLIVKDADGNLMWDAKLDHVMKGFLPQVSGTLQATTDNPSTAGQDKNLAALYLGSGLRFYRQTKEMNDLNKAYERLDKLTKQIGKLRARGFQNTPTYKKLVKQQYRLQRKLIPLMKQKADVSKGVAPSKR